MKYEASLSTNVWSHLIMDKLYSDSIVAVWCIVMSHSRIINFLYTALGYIMYHVSLPLLKIIKFLF